MGIIKESMISHLKLIDSQLLLNSSTGKDLLEWMNPLINSFSDDGAIPYLLDTKERFRASPLASVIIWMQRAGLLPDEVLSIIQKKLIYLNDSNQSNDLNEGNNIKKLGDNPGWSMAEGVSVWSTSLAILALSITSKVENWDEKVKPAVLWLVGQQDENIKGWAYQYYKNCEVNVIITSLSLQALARVYQNCLNSFSKEEKKSILNALTSGYIYLKDTFVHKRKYSYWRFLDKANCTATTWALLALKEISNIADVNRDVLQFYEQNRDSCFRFILSSMPSKISQWASEQIVYESGAKYGKQKNYHSYTPTLLMQLMDLGLSPYHPKVINQIIWLTKNQNQWRINNYDREEVCTFTYAMVISTIVIWHRYVGLSLAQQLLRIPTSINEKIKKILFGVNSLNSHPVQLLNKNRMISYCLCLGFLFILLFFGSQLLGLINTALNFLIGNINTIVDKVIIALIVSGIMAVFGFIKIRMKRRKNND